MGADTIKINDVWSKYNHSLLFVLPLFSDFKILKTVTGPHIGYPFVQLCLDYGLDNTYMRCKGYENLENRKFLYLVFDSKKVQMNMKITTSSYHSLSDMLIDSKYFESIKRFDNKVMYVLEIPNTYNYDIQHIEKSRYSKVSQEYKDAVKLSQPSVPIDSNDIGVYLSVNNIPYSIVTKKLFFKDEMEKAIGSSVDSIDEYYTAFDKVKELYTPLIAIDEL